MKAAGKPYRTGRGNEEYEKGYEGGGEGKEKKNLIHFRLTSFVRRFTRGRRRHGMGRVGGGALVLGMRK